MPKMDISVIVPIYNVAEYIEECIQSLCHQTFKGEFEVILVDDCGTDNSIDIALSTLKNQSNVKWQVLRNDQNRGLSAARNSGMEVANGEYVLFVDSDDILVPQSLELLYTKAQETGANVTAGAYETFGDGVDSQIYGQIGGYVMAWNKLCRRVFLADNNISFIEGLVHEDCPWNFELTVTNTKFATVEEVTYRYRIRENSLQTGRDFQKHFDAYCRILQAYADTIAKRNVPGMLWFLEQQKALYFSMTMEQGTSSQLRFLYSLIRTLGPKPDFSKPDAHYSMPMWLGFVWYRKFHKYHLC